MPPNLNEAVEPTDHEFLASILEGSGEYRVLRRLHIDAVPLLPQTHVHPDDIINVLYLDLETTGLDHATAEPIEFAALKCRATLAGEIIDITDRVSWLQEPSSPIPHEVTLLTGITNEMVAGHRFDLALISKLIEDVSLVIAHHADFDRTFAERIDVGFKSIPWGCTQSQIPWRDLGYDSSRLTSLTASHGYFYDAHRAMDDCVAGLLLLTQKTPDSRETVLKRLLHRSQEASVRIWAIGSPYDKKDVLKARGYQWTDGTSGAPKCWWTEVPQSQENHEIEFLQANVLGPRSDPPRKFITSLDRFTARG